MEASIFKIIKNINQINTFNYYLLHWLYLQLLAIHNHQERIHIPLKPSHLDMWWSISNSHFIKISLNKLNIINILIVNEISKMLLMGELNAINSFYSWWLISIFFLANNSDWLGHILLIIVKYLNSFLCLQLNL